MSCCKHDGMSYRITRGAHWHVILLLHLEYTITITISNVITVLILSTRENVSKIKSIICRFSYITVHHKYSLGEDSESWSRLAD